MLSVIMLSVAVPDNNLRNSILKYAIKAVVTCNFESLQSLQKLK
jgi:hypothetical protein